MGWHTGTATDYKDLLSQLVLIATRQGATSLDSIVAAGTGYAVGDILSVNAGTPTTHPTKIRVLTVSAGVILTAKLQEAGAYTTPPVDPVATTVIPPGVGTGATFTLAYASNGWTALRDTTYTFEGDATHKEVVLQGVGGGSDSILVGVRTFARTVGADATRAWVLAAMTGFTAGTTYPTLQAGESPGWDAAVVGGGCFVPLATLLHTTVTLSFELSVTSRRIVGRVRPSATIAAWVPFYLGWMNPFATASEFPYPILVCGAATNRDALFTDVTLAEVTGFGEMIAKDGLFGPALFRQPDSEWIFAANSTGIAGSRGPRVTYGFYPGMESALKDGIVGDGNFAWHSIILHSGDPGPATLVMKPTPGTGAAFYPLVPITLVQSSGIDFDVLAEMDGCFWVTGSGLGDQDTVSVGDDRYRVTRSGHRNQLYSFFAIKEA